MTDSDPQRSLWPSRKARASALPNMKTACSRRGIVPLTRQPSHREGHMPVTIGRRELMAALASAGAWPLVVRAQERRRIPKVGVLWHAGSAEQEGALFTALAEGFRALGYIDGHNIILEHRFPNEMPERFRSM